MVPFGAKRVFTSIVIKKHKNIPDNYEPKEIFAFQDDLPVVDKNQIFFCFKAVAFLISCSRVLMK